MPLSITKSQQQRKLSVKHVSHSDNRVAVYAGPVLPLQNTLQIG